jgi:hypothetical protein
MNHPGQARKWLLLAALALAAALPGRAAEPVGGPPAAAARSIELDIVHRKPEGGVRTIRLRRGEAIVLRIRSDEKLSVHVHGYDVHQDVVPGAQATLRLVARWEGRFPVGAHLAGGESGRHAPEPTLLYLEVYPD